MAGHRTIDILFHIETLAQVESVLPLIALIKSKNLATFDIVVPSSLSTNIYEDCADHLEARGFNVTRGKSDVELTDLIVKTKYKILLSAYMYQWHYDNLEVDYRIMYPYASYYFNKPNWTIERFIRQDYMADALLSHAIGTKPVTDIFTQTHIVPSLKLMDYRKKARPSKKPVIFFAPTYSELDFAKSIIGVADDIKKNYRLVMRGHQKSGNTENGSLAQLYGVADEVFDAKNNQLVDVLQEADIVVSDNSAVIFDAIYCGVPVMLFSSGPNTQSYFDIDTAQSTLFDEGYIKWTDNPGSLLGAIKQTLTPESIRKQKSLTKKLFPYSGKDNAVNAWMDVIGEYLSDGVGKDYTAAKRYWVQRINGWKEELEVLRLECGELHKQIQYRNELIAREQNPGVMTSLRRLLKAIYRKLYIKPLKRAKHALRLSYRKVRIKLFNDPIVIYQFVFTEPYSMNFGDELTKDIIERIFHKKTEVHNEIDTRFDMLGVGSLIHFFNDIVDYKTYVWGSGLIDDQVGAINENFIFKACRGELTKSKIPDRYQGIPLGDPGLLCNLIYKNEVQKTGKIGVIPHLRDEQSYFLNDVIKRHPEIFTIIPVSQSPERVADEIKRCRLVMSSSLHGLIVSDSFAIPNIHLYLSDNLQSPNHLRGGLYKFKDYYTAINRKYKNFDPRERDLLDASAYDQIIDEYEPISNLDQIQNDLIKSFPYR